MRKAFVACAILAAALVAAAAGVHAYWSAQVSVPGATFTAGTLDLTVDGALGGSGGSVDLPALALPDAIPGESVAGTVTVGNAGNQPFEWNGHVTAVGAMASDLTVTVVPGGTAVNIADPTAGGRRGACEGGTPGPTAPEVLTPGANATWCIVVELSATAPSSLQGTTAQVTLDFTAEQVPR